MLVGKEIGPFLVERELGCGAMGTVYRAIYRDTGQRVALKFIAIGLLGNETAIKRFEREANILKQLRHPNIVRPIAHGRYQKTPFIAMEYVEGESLDRVLARRGAFPWNEVVDLGRQLCDALGHAHEKGIIHRDLKPSNVMILKDGTIKLTDFGIAKDMDVTALTGANNTVGTAAYMSPEQCKGERNLSAKSDLYSMGVMFYELLTGRKPFVAESPIDMFHAHVYGTFERPSRLVMEIPIWLDTLVCQLLEKKPEHRPFDAAMVYKVLGEVEEKFAAQRSAGVDAVTARRIDRIPNQGDETDRDAARTLRAATLNKKLRKKVVPVGERKWVRAIGLLTALAAVIGVIVWATKPPNADQLYARARSAIEAKDADRAVDLIGRYLSLYGPSDDTRAKELRNVRELFMAERRERQLHNRFYSRLNQKPEDDGQRLAYDAIRLENDGKADDAKEVWRELEAKFATAEDLDVAVYGWVGRKKLADLANREARLHRLGTVLDEMHTLVPTEPLPELDRLERLSLEALRFERFEDAAAAREHWDDIAKHHLPELESRPWAVLAAKNARRLAGEALADAKAEKEARLQLLRKRLDQAQAVTAQAGPGDTTTAVVICRDIIDLYGKDPDSKVSAFAEEARRLMKTRGWR
jgi:serine/threonine-protein kinase